MLKAALITALIVMVALPVWAASPKMKMTTTPAPGIAMPDKVESRLGELRFFDGFPDKTTAQNSTTISISRAARLTCWPSPR